MRAWVLDAPGRLEDGVLRLQAVAEPVPGPGEILVDVEDEHDVEFDRRIVGRRTGGTAAQSHR